MHLISGHFLEILKSNVRQSRSRTFCRLPLPRDRYLCFDGKGGREQAEMNCQSLTQMVGLVVSLDFVFGILVLVLVRGGEVMRSDGHFSLGIVL